MQVICTIASHSSIFKMVTVVNPHFICSTVEEWGFRSTAPYIVQVDGSRGTTSKECLLQSYSLSTVSQLSADHCGIQLIPVVITHSAVPPSNAHLHCTLCCISAIYQSNCTMHTACIQIYTVQTIHSIYAGTCWETTEIIVLLTRFLKECQVMIYFFIFQIEKVWVFLLVLSLPRQVCPSPSSVWPG